MNKTSGGGLLEIPCGRGKCLAKGTKILMYDGNIKSVEDIIVGDVIMGDDSTPRNILSTTSGVEQMYDINLDINNETYRVNESHILSLKSISDYNNVIKNGSIIDISVKEYLELPSKLKDILYGYKVGIEFNKVNIETDPYLFGYWLINNNKVYSKKEVENNKNNNPFFNFLLKSGIIYSTSTGYELNKHIPINYKCNEGKIRSAHYQVYLMHVIIKNVLWFQH